MTLVALWLLGVVNAYALWLVEFAGFDPARLREQHTEDVRDGAWLYGVTFAATSWVGILAAVLVAFWSSSALRPVRDFLARKL